MCYVHKSAVLFVPSKGRDVINWLLLEERLHYNSIVIRNAERGQHYHLAENYSIGLKSTWFWVIGYSFNGFGSWIGRITSYLFIHVAWNKTLFFDVNCWQERKTFKFSNDCLTKLFSWKSNDILTNLLSKFFDN